MDEVFQCSCDGFLLSGILAEYKYKDSNSSNEREVVQQGDQLEGEWGMLF